MWISSFLKETFSQALAN